MKWFFSILKYNEIVLLYKGLFILKITRIENTMNLHDTFIYNKIKIEKLSFSYY
jgi:hypothetical protein